MKNRKFVVPKEGVKVHDDLMRIIPPKGAWVNYTTLISRIVKDGDLKVIDKKPEQEQEEIKAEKEKAKETIKAEKAKKEKAEKEKLARQKQKETALRAENKKG